MKINETREKIIAETIQLIRESNGLSETITIRKIAKHADVGIGLVNHYFGSKEKLLEECVQRIISGVISAFNPSLTETESAIESAKRIAKEVMDFLMENSEISKISILGDLKHPGITDNTMRSVYGFERRLSNDRPEASARLHAFMITAILQVAFLRRDSMLQTLGINFNEKWQRDAFIDEMIERFYPCGM